MPDYRCEEKRTGRKERRDKGLRLQERDKEVLRDISKCRMLTADQIRRLHYPGVEWWHYTRLSQLVRVGFLRREVSFPGGKQRAVCYFLTEQGARAIKANIVRTRNSFIDSHHRAFWRDLMEIYVCLRSDGWDWLDSRAGKQKFGINRASALNGVLKSPWEEFYGVYLLGRATLPKTIAKVKEEIKLIISTRLRNFIIFSYSPAVLESFPPDTLGATSLHLLDYPCGLEALKKLGPADKLLRLLGENDLPRAKVFTAFASVLVQSDEGEHYATEILTNDLAKVYHLQRFTRERSLKDGGRGVHVLVQDKDLKKYQEMFSVYPHIKFYPIAL